MPDRTMGPVERALRQAAALPPTKGAYARDARGYAVRSWSEQACVFCPLAALWKTSAPAQAKELLIDACVKRVHASREHAILRTNDQTDLMPDAWSEAIECAAELGI